MKNNNIHSLLLCTFLFLHISSFAQNVGVGIVAPLGKLHVKGSADISQLIIEANSTQSNINPVLKLRKSDGTDLMWIHSDDSTNVFLGLKAGRVNVIGPQGINNTFVGSRTGYSNTNGRDNVALGTNALFSQSFSPPAGAYWTSNNVAVGADALYSNQPTNSGNGVFNTAVGTYTLRLNTTGTNNTASGSYALYANTTGSNNTANGVNALFFNTTASENTAVGNKSLFIQSYTPGSTWVSANVAVGYEALYFNQPTTTLEGVNNTAVGHSSMRANTTGFDNTGIGSKSLYANTSGYNNTATGRSALYNNTTGHDNVASGPYSLYSNTIGNFNITEGFNSLYSNTSGSDNIAIGEVALGFNSTAGENIAIGTNALYNQSFSNINTPWISGNVAVGFNALYSNEPTATSNGIANTAIGNYSLYTNTTGYENTGIGSSALIFNSTGYQNTAMGREALFNNSSGNNNTASGYKALRNSNGYNNTAIGSHALETNTSASGNTACGYAALFSNVGGQNTAVGYNALHDNSTGNNNTAIGYTALEQNIDGNENVAVGRLTLFSSLHGSNNCAIGYYSLYNLESGISNVAIGYQSGTAFGSPNVANTISIGNDGALNAASNQALIGNFSTTWNGGNKVWSTYSDARIKNHIEEDVKGLDFISRLRPVTYYRSINAAIAITGDKATEDYPEKYDVEKIKESGFLAQEVEQAAKDANYDFSGITIPKKSTELYTLSYESFVVPLVKSVQELNEGLITQNTELRKTISDLQSQIDELKLAIGNLQSVTQSEAKEKVISNQ